MCKYYHLLFFLTVYCIKNNCDEIEPSSPNLIHNINKADKPPALLDKLVPDSSSSQVHSDPSSNQQQSANSYPGPPRSPLPMPPPSSLHEADNGVPRPSPYFNDLNSPSPLPLSVVSRPSERNEEIKNDGEDASEMRQESVNNSSIHDSEMENKTSHDVSTNSSSSASHVLESSQNSSRSEDHMPNNTTNEVHGSDTSNVNPSTPEQVNISMNESKIDDRPLSSTNESIVGTNHSDYENSVINSTAAEDQPYASHEIHKRSVESFVSSDTQNFRMKEANVHMNDAPAKMALENIENNNPTDASKMNETMKLEQVNSANVNISSKTASSENDTEASVVPENNPTQELAGEKSNTQPENASIELNRGETSSSSEIRSEVNEEIRSNDGTSYSSFGSENSYDSLPNVEPAQETVSSSFVQENEALDAGVSANNNASSLDLSQPNVPATQDSKSFENSPLSSTSEDTRQKDETNEVGMEAEPEVEKGDVEEEERSSYEEEIVFDESKENTINEKSEGESPVVSTPFPDYSREISQPADQHIPSIPHAGNPELSVGLASQLNDPNARVLPNDPANVNVISQSSDTMERDTSKQDSSPQNQLADDRNSKFSESMSNNLTPDGTARHNQHADNSASLTQHSSPSDESKYALPVEPNLTKEMFSDSKSLEYSAIPGLDLLTDLLPEPLRDSLEHVDFPLRVFVLIIVVSIFWLMMFTVHAFFSYKSDRDTSREELCRKDKQVHDIGLERDHLACELDSAIKQIKDLERNSRAREEDLRRREVSLR